MNTRELNPKDLGKTEDWAGNNIAVTCPVCEKVYVVSGLLHREGRKCPNLSCGKSKAFVKRGKDSDGKASIQWES